MNKRYYKKKGSSYKERLRCPLCGKLSSVAYFSIDHRLDVCRYTYAGRGKISVAVVLKDAIFMQMLKQSFVGRFISLLKEFTGMKYYSQSEVDLLVSKYKPVSMFPKSIVPISVPERVPERANLRVGIVPRKVVVVK